MSLTRVVAANVSGTEYDTVPVNLASGVGGNGGSATKIGAGNSYLDGVEISRVDTGDVFGSTVLDNNVADKALDAGVFAYNNNVPVAKRLTSELSSVSNDYLVSGASVPSGVQSIHALESLNTTRTATGIRENKYNRFDNVWESGYPVTAVDSFGADSAANPTRDIPGSLTYLNGKDINIEDYSAKNG